MSSELLASTASSGGLWVGVLHYEGKSTPCGHGHGSEERALHCAERMRDAIEREAEEAADRWNRLSNYEEPTR